MTEALASSHDGAFDVDTLLDDAHTLTGSSDGAASGLEALRRLTAALDAEAALTPSGRQAVRRALLAQLVIQIRARQAKERSPEIATTVIDRPVFVTGMLRTGTTLIHNLLAEHPDLRAPQLWELLNPVSERLDTEGERLLVNRAREFVEEYNRAAPAFPAAHFLDALRPDECQRLTGVVFTSMVYELRYQVPSYGDWLYQQDQFDAYAMHRALLQHILWRVPGERAVLKCPFHLWRLPALASAYPDARIVHMHRDPAVTIPSTCSLTEIVRGARSDRIDRPAIGRLWESRIGDAIDELERVRTELTGVQILDVSYAGLMADPIGTLGTVCDFAGVPITGAAERAIRAYLDANPQRKHGAHQYRAEDYGLDGAQLQKRFADYTAQYAS